MDIRTTRDVDTRGLDTTMRIDAPIDAVWKALTDAEELTRWFPLEARVTPGVGGAIWMSWRNEYEFTSPIDVWEPPTRLRVIHCEPCEATAQFPAVPHRVAVEYTLEADAGATVLRLVHSGFGSDSVWDEQYDATRRGWALELRGLRHYLERHRGRPRALARIRLPFELPLDEAWARIGGSRGLALPANLGAGDLFSARDAQGETLEGVILLCEPPLDLAARITSLHDAYLLMRLDHWRMGRERREVNLHVSTYALPEGHSAALERRLHAMIEPLLA